MAKKRIGVLLSGCGVFDGAEIHEATLTLFFLDRAGAEALCMAPDISQHHIINHMTGQEMPGTRNVLIESARIARGNIRNLATVSVTDVDGVILPGGFGAAKNLSSVAFDGPKAKVDPGVAAFLRSVREAGKPIGALCITPAVISRIFADQGLTLTIGDDPGTASAIEAMGNVHQNSTVDAIVVDKAHKIITSAAYMCEASIGAVGQGIEKLVAEVLRQAGP
ncbi:MAG: isoprenoid biosynthesis glyoxalase ElbB [Magnetococcales bacterium]|nr:isoprenoid biosynthesis glyoxalase ElbB [Magnetococcales bacterium]